MRYLEFAPVAALAPVVERLWTLEGHADMLGGEPQRVLPDGRTELVLHLGDGFHRENGREFERQAPILFAGQLTRELVLRPSGAIRVLGVRLHPHGAAAVLNVPQDELSGETPDLACLDRRLARDLSAMRDSTADLIVAVARVQAILLSRISLEAIDHRVAHVVRAIDVRRGNVSIDALAHNSGMTRRHLERQFRRHVGMSPKRLARITRFQTALRLLESIDPAVPQTGAMTAAQCGYADQAHFVRDFRELAGCPPTAHLLNKGLLADFFRRSNL